MGQTYRLDPSTGRCSIQEPSPAMIAWLRSNVDGKLLIAPVRVMRACQHRGFVRCLFGRHWRITRAGLNEVDHYDRQAATIALAGAPNARRRNPHVRAAIAKTARPPP
ncbi:MAG TPA: hypothetical protein VHE37_15395 [Nevskiaceae bacterium]|nr:hypothetical protein [Nevskiaceae bacterium]